MKKCFKNIAKLLMAGMLCAFLFTGCDTASGSSSETDSPTQVTTGSEDDDEPSSGGEPSTGGDSSTTNPSSGTDTKPDTKKGHKVTVHWQIPGETETLEDTYADAATNKYEFDKLSKEREGYTLLGFKDKAPKADDYSVVYRTDAKKTLSKDIDVYALWKNDSILINFYYKEKASTETNVKVEQKQVATRYEDFVSPDVDKENDEKACTYWAKSDGTYACEANSKTSLYDMYIYPSDLSSKYDETDMAYYSSCYDFYEYWYSKSTMKIYSFNMNDCASSKDLDKCEVKTIKIGPKSKANVDVAAIDFKREGYTLEGYSTDPIATSVYSSPSFKSGTTYYAIWKKDNAYISTYVKEADAANLEWERVESDDSDYRLSKGEFFTKEGYVLGGWNGSDNVNSFYAEKLPGQINDPKFWNSRNVWYAKWVEESTFKGKTSEILFYSDETKNEDEKFTETAYAYPAKYNSNGSWVVDRALVLPECPFIKEGKTFAGWKNLERGNSVYQPGEAIQFEKEFKGLYGNTFIAIWE